MVRRLSRIDSYAELQCFLRELTDNEEERKNAEWEADRLRGCRCIPFFRGVTYFTPSTVEYFNVAAPGVSTNINVKMTYILRLIAAYHGMDARELVKEAAEGIQEFLVGKVSVTV